MGAGEQVNALLTNGNAAYRSKDYDVAIDAFTRAIAIASREWGDHAYQMVYPLLGLARALGRGYGIDPHPDIAIVLDLEGRAVAIAENYPAIYDQQLPRMVGGLGSTLRIAGQNKEAVHCLEKCVAISERVFGDTWDTAHALGNLASLLLEMKRADDALPLFQRSLTIEESLQHERTNFATPALLGRCLLDLGRREEALPYLETAFAIGLDRGRALGKQTSGPIELREWIEEARGRSP
jgi:tetratricopeptide (TPR) repeat protein